MLIKNDVFLWPVVAAVMFFIVSSKGGNFSEQATATFLGFVFGGVIALGLSRLKKRIRTRVVLNFLLAIVLGLVFFGIGYPNLMGPRGQLDQNAIWVLGLASSLPFIAVICLTLVPFGRSKDQMRA